MVLVSGGGSLSLGSEAAHPQALFPLGSQVRGSGEGSFSWLSMQAPHSRHSGRRLLRAWIYVRGQRRLRWFSVMSVFEPVTGAVVFTWNGTNEKNVGKSENGEDASGARLFLCL